MPLPTGLWLWCDGEKLRWWSVYAQGYVDVAHTPSNTSGSLADILEDSAEEAFSRSLEEPGNFPSSIYLMDSLPDAWMNDAWEERRLRSGQRIGDYAPVVRHVSLAAPYPVTINRNTPMLMLRMYCDDNFKPKKWKGKDVQRALNEQDLRDKLNDHPDAPLLIFAHGNNGEDRCSNPLKDAAGNPWAWPENITPPSVIIILSCDHAGHQRSFALYLLKKGAKSVVIATDLLNAREAWRMAEDFSSARIKDHFSLAEWVAAQENLELWGVDAICSTDSWANRLYLRAKSTLFQKSLAAMQRHKIFRQHAKQIQNGMVAQSRHNQPSASEFLDDLDQQERMTAWLSLKTTLIQTRNLAGSIDRSANLWRDAYDLDKEDEHNVLAWLSTMQQLLPQWRKQGWDEVIRGVLPLALELSERHQHELMTFFRGFCTQEESKRIHAALAKVCYRKGDYCLSLRHIAQALDGEGKSMVSLFTLLNILIDLNLPTLGTALLSIIRLRLDNLPEKDIHGRQFKLLDQCARLHIRSGHICQAIRLIKQKKTEQDLNHRENYREVAWLLFLYAWENPKSVDAQKLAQLAQAYLKCDDIHVGDGNADYKYIARALACWAWRADQLDTAAVIKDFWQRACHKEYGYDPGPLGHTIAYIALLENSHAEHGWASEEWPHARDAMQDEGYWLETTILDALLGEAKQSRLAFKKFAALRNNAIKILSKLAFSLLWNRKDMDAATQRETDIKAILFNHEYHVPSDHCEMIKALAQHGMLPL